MIVKADSPEQAELLTLRLALAALVTHLGKRPTGDSIQDLALLVDVLDGGK